MSTLVQPLRRGATLERPLYEGAFGLLLVAVLVLTTLDEGALATVGRGFALVGFAFLTITNAGAALGVYIAASLLFSQHHFQGQGSWVERPDNYALLFLVFYLSMTRCFGRTSGRFGWTAIAAVLLLATTLGHLVALVGFSPYELSWFARMFAIPLAMFVLFRRVALAPREISALLLIVASIAVYAAVVSLLEKLAWYTLIVPPWLTDPAFNPAFGDPRVGGLSMQPEWNALVMSLTFCAILLRLDQKPSLSNFGWLAGGGLCLLAIYFTYTRGAWLGLLFGGVPLFWQMSATRGVTIRRRVLFVSCALGFAALVLLAPSDILRARTSDVNTVYFRVNIWAAGLRMVVDHPLIGVGYGQFSSYVPSYFQVLGSIPLDSGLRSAGSIAHNTFLSVAAELGLVGLTLYLLVLGGGYRAAHAAAGIAWGQRGRSWVAGMTLVYLVNVQFITAHELLPNILYFGFMGAVAGMRGPGGKSAGAAPSHARS